MYAKRRNEYIRNARLTWSVLTDETSMAALYEDSFGRELLELQRSEVRNRCNKVWYDLSWQRIQNLPQLGQGKRDFKTFNDVLITVSQPGSSLARFVRESPSSLRRLGHGKAAENYQVAASLAEVKREISVFEWY